MSGYPVLTLTEYKERQDRIEHQIHLKNLPNSGLCHFGWRQDKTERKWRERDKFLDLVRELKKLWNMKVMVMLVVFGALGTITKILVQGLKDLEIRGQAETIHCWGPPEYWEDSWRFEVTCHSDSNEKPSANTCVKNSQSS